MKLPKRHKIKWCKILRGLNSDCVSSVIMQDQRNTKLHYLVAVSKQMSPLSYSVYLDEELTAMGCCQYPEERVLKGKKTLWRATKHKDAHRVLCSLLYSFTGCQRLLIGSDGGLS